MATRMTMVRGRAAMRSRKVYASDTARAIPADIRIHHLFVFTCCVCLCVCVCVCVCVCMDVCMCVYGFRV